MPVLDPRLIVELYEGWGFSGKRAVIVDSTPDLREIGMYDRVFSLRIFKGPAYDRSPDQKVVLYDREGYDGNRLALGPGFYPNVQDVVRRFRTVRSIKLEATFEVAGPEWGPVPVIIEAFARKGFTHRRTTIIRDVANARDIGMNEMISSLRIFKGPDFPRHGCRVILFSEPDFDGLRLPIEMHPADRVKAFEDLALLPQSFGDLISSIQIEGWTTPKEFDTVVFEEDFSRDRLHPSWQWTDPRGGGDWRVRQGFLRMSAEPGQDLWFGGNFDAPRLTRPIRGDFAIETRIAIDSAQNAHGGLLVWKNEHRFLRLEKTSKAHAFRGDVRFERHQWQHYELVGRGSGLQRARDLYLRLERKGDVFVGYASEDGVTWQYCGATVMGMSDPIRVGLHALAPGNVPPTLTQFDFFRVLRRKKDLMRRERERARQNRARAAFGYRRFLEENR